MTRVRRSFTAFRISTFEALDYCTAYDVDGNELAGWARNAACNISDASGSSTRLMLYRTPGEASQNVTFHVCGSHMDEDDYIEITAGMDSYGDFSRYYTDESDINDSSKSSIVLINGVQYLYTGIDHDLLSRKSAFI